MKIDSSTKTAIERENVNGNLHKFRAESFFNRHYVLTLIVYEKPLNTCNIIVP